MKLLPSLIACGVLSVTASAALAQSRPVDVALVLALDSSSSVDYEEYALQVRGLASAFRDERVLAAIVGGAYRTVAVSVVEWASGGPGNQAVNIGWRLIDSAGAAEAFAAEIEAMPRSFDAGGTSIHDGLLFAQAQFASCPCVPLRQVVDVSGDGRENTRRDVLSARGQLLAAGITVNGLPIHNEDAQLEAYYAQNVIGGPGAFVVPAKDYADFARAIAEKLERELAPAAIALSEQNAPVAARL
jgi:hypothetical protein